LKQLKRNEYNSKENSAEVARQETLEKFACLLLKQLTMLNNSNWPRYGTSGQFVNKWDLNATPTGLPPWNSGSQDTTILVGFDMQCCPVSQSNNVTDRQRDVIFLA